MREGPGARLKTLAQLNRKTVFDCPAERARPRRRRSHLVLRERAKAVAEEATVKRVTPEFFRQWSVADLSLKSDFWLGKQGRITHPMILRRGATHYEPLSWEEAFSTIAKELNALDSPDEAAFYTSGRASNEAAFLYQLFVRQFGTNNLPDCSNMCHESSGTALTRPSASAREQSRSKTLIWPGPSSSSARIRERITTHADGLQKAKKNGCKIVHINPLPETASTASSTATPARRARRGHAALRPLPTGARQRRRGSAEGIMKEVLDEEERRPGEVLDWNFIRERPQL